MAKVGLNFLVTDALKACQAEAETVFVYVTMSGGDRWDTGDGSEARSFTITLEG
jgi:hypothetical protein